MSDSHIKIFRSNLKMPAFILDEKERNCFRFMTKNNLLEDPLSFEEERKVINPWTQEERIVFMEMLATFGKDFRKISFFLSHKTTADCIEFYYKNHKSESFRDVKKQLDSQKQQECLPTNTYMVTTGKQQNHEVNAASLDMLGPAPVIAAHKKGHTRNQQKYSGRTALPSYHSRKVSRANYRLLERVDGVEISASDKETAAANVLAGMRGTLSSEAVSSCIASSVNCVTADRPLTPGISQFIEEEDACSDEDRGELSYSIDWTDDEKSEFIRALSTYGKDFANISHRVGTKSRDQCKIFFSKARKCLGLDTVQPAAGNVEAPISDANGGRSDMNDACAEGGSAICSTQSCSKVAVDNSSCEGFVCSGNSSSQTETGRSSEQYAIRGSNKDELDLKSALKVEKLSTNLQVFCIPEGVDDNSLSCNSDGFSENVKPREAKKVHVHSSVEQTTTCIKNEQLKPQSSVNILQKDATVRRFPADVVKTDVDLRQQFLLSSEIQSGEQCNRVNLSTAEESEVYTAGIASYAVSKTNGFQQLKPLESISCLQKKPRYASSHDPSSIYSECSIRVTSSLTINFEGCPNKLRKVSDQQSLLGNQLVNLIDDALGEKLPMLGTDRYSVTDTNIEKYSVSAVSSSRSVMSLPTVSENQSDSKLRPYLHNACEEGEEQSTHVKLFGQILGNSPSSKKSSSLPLESGIRVRSPKRKKSAAMKPSASEKDFASTHVTRRNNGFREGNKIQTCFSSLTESPFVYENSVGFSNAGNELPVGGKRPLELKKRNGFEITSGFQRPGVKAMARLGVNTAGDAGVSDPVVAILTATRMPVLLAGEEQLRTDFGGT